MEVEILLISSLHSHPFASSPHKAIRIPFLSLISLNSCPFLILIFFSFLFWVNLEHLLFFKIFYFLCELLFIHSSFGFLLLFLVLWAFVQLLVYFKLKIIYHIALKFLILSSLPPFAVYMRVGFSWLMVESTFRACDYCWWILIWAYFDFPFGCRLCSCYPSLHYWSIDWYVWVRNESYYNNYRIWDECSFHCVCLY